MVRVHQASVRDSATTVVLFSAVLSTKYLLQFLQQCNGKNLILILCLVKPTQTLVMATRTLVTQTLVISTHLLFEGVVNTQAVVKREQITDDEN